MPTTKRTLLCSASMLLAAACSSPRRASRVPAASADPSASTAPARDLSVVGRQGVSGELVRSHASSHVLIGIETLDGDAWGPIDQHLYSGFETSFETEGDWFGGEFGMSIAQPEDEEALNDPELGVGRFDVDLNLIEAYAGLHRSFLRNTRVKPYVGAGLSLVYYDARQQFRAAGNPTVEDEESDFTCGLYLHGGVALQLGETFQIGLDLRALGGTDTHGLLRSGDLDYQRVSLFVGVGD